MSHVLYRYDLRTAIKCIHLNSAIVYKCMYRLYSINKWIFSQSETPDFQNFLAELHAPNHPRVPFLASVNLPQDQTPDII
jgi:hypothetical protein